jgi:hypothetical protein
MNKNNHHLVTYLIIGLVILAFILGRYTVPKIECPEIESDTITIVEYREPASTIDTIYVTAEIIDTVYVGAEGAVFVQKFLELTPLLQTAQDWNSLSMKLRMLLTLSTTRHQLRYGK